MFVARSSLVNRRRSSLPAAALAALAVVVAACGGDPLPDAGTVSVAVAPASVNIAQGGEGTAAVTITRGGTFTGPVTLTQTGAPTGVTVAFTPALAASGITTSIANITVATTAAAGSYPITIRATGDSVPAATTPFTIVVLGAGGGSATVTFCEEDAPIWVAAQDGTGAWTRVTPTSGTTYQFTFATGKGGIATVDTVGTGTDLAVVYGTLADFTAFAGTVNNNRCATNRVVNGQVSGVSATEAAIINLGGSSALVTPPQTGFVLNSVPSGLKDLVATRVDGVSRDVNWIILRRSLSLPDGFVLPTLTFGSEGFPSVSANVNVTNLGADAATVGSLFTGVRGSASVFLSTIEGYVAATPAQPYAAIPASQLAAGELQEVVALSQEAGNLNSERTAGVYFSSVSDRTVALGPGLSAPTVTKVVTGAIVRPNVQLPSQPEYNRYLSATYTQPASRSANVVATAAYFGGVPSTWDVTVPDLSTVPGWTPAWGLQNGTPIEWDVSAHGGAITFLDLAIADGSTTRSATLRSSAPLAVRGPLAERTRGPVH